MRLIVLSLLMVAAIATGCATARNTPAQDLTWERWKARDHFSAVTLERVDLDGRLVVAGYVSEAAPFTACVREAATTRFAVASPQVRRPRCS